MEETGYLVIAVKAWDKETLARKLAKLLDPYPAQDIVSIGYQVDFGFPLPFRRNSALVVLRKLDRAE